MTATLRPRLTIEQAAKLMNVSERSVYLARELIRTGREDLCAKVEAGQLKILDALRLAKPEKYVKRRDRLRELRNVWRLATSEERAAFLSTMRGEAP